MEQSTDTYLVVNIFNIVNTFFDSFKYIVNKLTKQSKTIHTHKPKAVSLK